MAVASFEKTLLPTRFTATTLKKYDCPFTGPGRGARRRRRAGGGAAAVGGVLVSPPLVVALYTSYRTIGCVPLDDGGVQLSVTPALPGVADRPVGGPGTAGVSSGVADVSFEKTLMPTAFKATTLKKYAEPLDRPVTVHVLAAAPEAVHATGATAISLPRTTPLYTSYRVMAEPPFDAGGDQWSVTCVSPAAADRLVGTSGTLAGGVPVCTEPALHFTPVGLCAPRWSLIGQSPPFGFGMRPRSLGCRTTAACSTSAQPLSWRAPVLVARLASATFEGEPLKQLESLPTL